MAGIYIHVPFCKKACFYCNFYFSTSLRLRDSYLNALLTEITLQKEYLASANIASIYFGGGTPSLLTGVEITKILTALAQHFSWSPTAEITLEANPDDLTLGKLQELKQAGINRLSIGVQSFRDQDLRLLNRAHTAEQAITALKHAQELGFAHSSLDLIYAIPGLTHSAWQQNLAQAVTLGFPHISAYHLTVEARTALEYMVKKNQITPVNEEMAAEQFEMAIDYLQAMGYHHYEISNFAKQNYFAQHNSSYWQEKTYLGLGPSAHSYDLTSRQWNVSSIKEYVAAISQGKIPAEKEILTQEQRYQEYLLTSLRTMWGCSLTKIANEFSDYYPSFIKTCQFLQKVGLVQQQNQQVVLTREGKLVADSIILRFCTMAEQSVVSK